MRRSPLFVIFLTVFLDLLGFGLIIPILPYYAERFGATPSVITLIMASYSLMQFLFAPLWGRLSDRIGRRPIILLSLAVSTVGYTLLGFAGSLTHVFAARILAGIGNANLPTAQAYVADVTKPEERARGMGLVGMAFGLGFVFGPAFGGFLGSVWIPLPAFLAAGLTAIDLVLAAFVLKEPERHAKGQGRPALSLSALIEASRRPNIGLLLALFFFATFAFAQLESTFSLYIEHRFTLREAASHGAVTTGGAIPDATHQSAARATCEALAVIGIVSAAIQGGLIGKLSRRFGEKGLARAGLFLLACGLALFPGAPTLRLLFPICAVIAVGSALLHPSLAALLSRSAGAHEQGQTLGLGQSLSSLARVMGPMLGGLLFQHVGLGAPYWTGSALMLLSLFLSLNLRPLPDAAVSTSPGLESA
jgi:MFS transporter, DHA1 family, tetracycline resistance protein